MSVAVSHSPIENSSHETERNRRKVMEINYFLDSQQIMYENLIADVGLEGEIFKSAAACESRDDDMKDENNADTTMKTDIDNEEGGDAVAVDNEMHHELSGDDDDDDSRNDVEHTNNNSM